MKKLNFLISLTNHDNDYQIEQAAEAEKAAQKLGVNVKIITADNDSITQSQQLLKVIQSSSDSHPDAIIFEPVGGTGLPQVARAAAAAGIGWVVLNRDADYIADLRNNFQVPTFCITSDHEQIGRIQGQQLTALLPAGKTILCIEGPTESLAAKQRARGLMETKPAEVQVKAIRGQWTEASAHKAVSSWLRLSTSLDAHMDAVAAQDDGMAVGAKKAFQQLPNSPARDRWLSIPFLGVDGMPKTGQAWVRSGLLTATIIVPPNTGKALEMLVQSANTGVMPPARTLTTPTSYPALGSLGAAQAEKARLLSI